MWVGQRDKGSDVGGRGAGGTVAGTLADLLAGLGVRVGFGVTGGPVAAFVHALEDHRTIRWHMARTEAGAVLEAVGACSVTGAPAVVVATCGPGVAALHQGLLVARSAGARIVVVSPRTPAPQRGRRVPQDSGPPSADFLVPGPLFDTVAAPESVDELAPLAAVLGAGLARRHGFLAHVVLPTDLLTRPAPPLPAVRRRPGRVVPDPELVAEVASVLRRRRCFVVAGRGARDDAGLVAELAAAAGAPVVTTPGAKGVVDERGPLAFGVTGIGGTAGTLEALRAVRPHIGLVLGSGLGPASVGADVVRLPRHGLVHVDRDPAAIGAAWDVPTLAVEAELRPFLEALLPAVTGPPRPLPARPALLPAGPPAGRPRGGWVRPRALMHAVQAEVVDGSDAPVLVEVGSVWPWATSSLCFASPHRLHLETEVGSMGTAVAGGVGAALATGRTAVVLTGDWSFDMALPELRTAVDHRAPVVWVVLQTFGGQMVRDGDLAVHGRSGSSASFAAADLTGAATALGARAVRVDDEDGLRPALRSALAGEGPCVVEVVADTSEAPSYGGRFDALRGRSR